MSLLFAQMAFLLLLAALLGGVCAWWLAQRRLQAVSADHTQLQNEWAQWRQLIDHRLAERPDPDWTPLMHRLGAIEKAVSSIRLPTPEPTNLRPVLDAVASIRMQPPPVIPAAQLEPLHGRLLSMETHLAALFSRLGAVENRLANLRIPEPMAAPNLQPLMASLLELQRAVAALRVPSASAMDGVHRQ